MIYQRNGRTIGIVVDLAEAKKEKMSRPVALRYMNWAEAQERVLEGSADALLQINTTEEREKVLDFSDPLLESDFSVFALSDGKKIINLI